MHAHHNFLFCYIHYWLASLFVFVPNSLCHTGRSSTSWRIPRLSGFARVGYPLPSSQHRWPPSCRSTPVSSVLAVRDLSEGCLFRVSPWPPGARCALVAEERVAWAPAGRVRAGPGRCRGGAWRRCFPVRPARCGYRRRRVPACRCAAVHRHARRPCSAPPPCAAGRWPAPAGDDASARGHRGLARNICAMARAALPSPCR